MKHPLLSRKKTVEPNLRRVERTSGFHWRWLAYAAVLASTGSLALAEVRMTYVPVDAPGNEADFNGFGAVEAAYRIGTYEVTNAEYTEFLNAVAATDPNALYNESMEITRSGTSGSYSYATTRDNYPVRFVSFHDAARFANWLHNGQPSGPQDATTTEDGAYTFAGPTSPGPRNAEARVFIPTDDEWYKAAYYRAADGTYWRYPTRSDMEPLASAPSGADGLVNYDRAAGDVTEVGAYSGSEGPFGTFDQAGNVWEWTESAFDGMRSIRGGSWDDYALLLDAAYHDSEEPDAEYECIGFRVAALPLGPGPAFQRGDVNQDSEADMSDAVSVFQFLFLGGSTPACLSAADPNDDSEVDISDGIHLLNFLFLGGPQPVEPFGACGVDPTPDELSCEAFTPCENP